MSRIAQTFSQLSAQGRKGLIPFITAGDPYPELTVDLMHALVKGGANVIELGVPFSDPMADGPVIQRASERALAKKIGLRTVLDYVRAFRATDKTTPVVLMGYANPIERMGIDAFAKAASEAGVDGVLVVDYPRGVRGVRQDHAGRGHRPDLPAGAHVDRSAHGADRPRGERLHLLRLAQGRDGCGDAGPRQRGRAHPADPPARAAAGGVGFGIRDAATARAIGGVADAVVIGSRIVQLLEEASREQAVQCLTDFIADIRQALDA